jgi:hypothetical protein
MGKMSRRFKSLLAYWGVPVAVCCVVALTLACGGGGPGPTPAPTTFTLTVKLAPSAAVVGAVDHTFTIDLSKGTPGNLISVQQYTRQSSSAMVTFSNLDNATTYTLTVTGEGTDSGFKTSQSITKATPTVSVTVQ